MAAEWRNVKSKMKAKIIDKGKGKKKDTISAFNEENDTSVVQRLIDLGVGETTGFRDICIRVENVEVSKTSIQCGYTPSISGKVSF